VNRCKYRPKLVVFCTISVKDRLVIIRIWNRIRHFGTGYDYRSLDPMSIL